MTTELDWGRVCKAIRDTARRNGGNADRATARLKMALEIAGPFSRTRAQAQHLGTMFLEERPMIIVPVCPDYPHDGSRYTFRGELGEGVSLLAARHIEFLRLVAGCIDAEVRVLYADQEADDTRLCQAGGVSREEFLRRVERSVDATRRALDGCQWNVGTMTTVLPELRSEEAIASATFAGNARYTSRLEADTHARIRMYQRINPAMPMHEMRSRTERTAAQYLGLAQCALRRRAVICNHTTVNLWWYAQVGAAVLHNQVDVY